MASHRDPCDLQTDVDAEERKHPGYRAAHEAGLQVALLRHRLRLRRVELGLSQAEVGRRMGVSQAAVSQLEAGADVTASKLARYMHALGVTDWAERVAAK